MKIYFSRVSVAHMRKESRDSSEMISQVLYGEAVLLLNEVGEWLHIRALRDQYTGWVDSNQFRRAKEFEEKNERLLCYSRQILLQGDSNELVLPNGSKFELQGDMILFEDRLYTYQGLLTKQLEPIRENIPNLLKAWYGTPYLWGGRSSFGVDCSGFTQSIFECFGLILPRDSSQQAKIGEPINFTETKAGDLAFFSKEGDKVYHVGLILADDKIAHCSAFFRIDDFKKEGIYRASEKRISHSLHSIRRPLNFI